MIIDVLIYWFIITFTAVLITLGIKVCFDLNDGGSKDDD